MVRSTEEDFAGIPDDVDDPTPHDGLSFCADFEVADRSPVPDNFGGSATGENRDRSGIPWKEAGDPEAEAGEGCQLGPVEWPLMARYRAYAVTSGSHRQDFQASFRAD